MMNDDELDKYARMGAGGLVDAYRAQQKLINEQNAKLLEQIRLNSRHCTEDKILKKCALLSFKRHCDGLEWVYTESDVWAEMERYIGVDTLSEEK